MRPHLQRNRCWLLLAVVASGVGVCWLWLSSRTLPPGIPTASPVADSRGAIHEPDGRGEVVSVPASPESAALGELRRQALAFVADYEARRDADDPEGADAVRLRFEALLTDATAAVLVRTLPPKFLESFFGDLALRRWARIDRTAAADWMAAHPSASPVPAAALAHNWVQTDPEGLHAYLDGLPAAEWKHLVAKSAGEEALVADQPMETLRLLNKITGADPRRDELYEWTVTKWAVTDPTAAANWAMQSADPRQGEKLLAAVAVGYANAAPAEAARWAVQTINDPEALRPVLPSIVRLWTAKDPEAAARWVDAFPAGPVKHEMVDGLLSIWAFRDLAAAQAWRKTIMDSVTRERAGVLLDRLAAEVNVAAGSR